MKKVIAVLLALLIVCLPVQAAADESAVLPVSENTPLMPAAEDAPFWITDAESEETLAELLDGEVAAGMTNCRCWRTHRRCRSAPNPPC